MPETIRVSLEFGPDDILPVGELAFVRPTAVFEYTPDFLGRGLILNPLDGPPARGIVRPQHPDAFNGLHGVFADSLPDAYGTLLMQRRADELRIDFAKLSPVDKLSIIGRRGPGALIYEPETHLDDDDDDDDDNNIDLDQLAAGADELLEGHDSELLPELERLGGPSGGARPKVLVAIDGDHHLRAGTDLIQPGYTSWIVKFPCSADLFKKDMGPLEAAYADMARAAGLDVFPTRLIETARGPGYFATQRFDRTPDNGRLHMLSVAGMLESNWAGATIDYHGLLNATRRVTRSEAAVLTMFRRMVFNALAHNQDDHIKQHSFLMDRAGKWRLAPAYDLSYSNGPAGHYLPIGTAVDDVRRSDILSVAERQGINLRIADQVFHRTADAVSNFATHAKRYGVTNSTSIRVSRELERILSLS